MRHTKQAQPHMDNTSHLTHITNSYTHLSNTDPHAGSANQNPHTHTHPHTHTQQTHAHTTSDTRLNQNHTRCANYTDHPTSTRYVTPRKCIDSTLNQQITDLTAENTKQHSTQYGTQHRIHTPSHNKHHETRPTVCAEGKHCS